MKPTPEQTQDLVDHFGSQRKAARAVGVSQGAIKHWLHPERDLANKRRWREANPEKQREYDRRHHNKLRDAGLCTDCRQPKVTEWYCWDCLDRKSGRGREWYASLSYREYSRKLLINSISAGKRRTAERNKDRDIDNPDYVRAADAAQQKAEQLLREEIARRQQGGK